MIKTNREDFKKELEEVICMFSSGEDLTVCHTQSANGKIFIDKVNINGKDYEFENTHNHTDTLLKKRFEKRFSKLALYSALSSHYGVKLTWGSLTGIRPVKMARDLGFGFEKELKNLFEVTDKKVDLVKEIIDTQGDLYDKNSEYSALFIGIPFCPSRCLYCSFISEEIGKSKYVKEYANALIKEINSLKGKVENVRSVYVGGGTPVCLPDGEFIDILSAIKNIIPSGIEFTVEAGRPDVITDIKLKIMKDFGVTRICVNPQTFLDKTLKIIGRKHTANDVIDKINLAKSYGFSINADVIAGLTGETLDDFKSTVDTAINLDIDNITVHTLCIKKGSKLSELTSRLKEGEIESMIDYAHFALKKAGYLPYYLYRQKYAMGNLENTGYAKKGTECVYNIDVMEENTDNIACGANAVSKRVFLSENRIERYGTPKDIKTYVDKIDKIIKEKDEFFGFDS